MRTSSRAILVTVIICLILPQSMLAVETPRFEAKVSPEMELLAGVLTQTSWMENRGPRGEGNEYFRALRDFFAPYNSHEAMMLAQEFTDSGFVYDAPVAFICHLGSLPELELRYEYSDYIVQRAKGRDRLERFRWALKDLADESNFLEFYKSWQPRFTEWLAASSMDGDKIVTWLEAFFGQQASEFHLLLAPAMFPGGGYGAIITDENEELISFQIIREKGESKAAPEFPTDKELEYLSLHEWGHSFVNPALEAHEDVVGRLQRFYNPVAKAMNRQAYSNVHTFMNEQVLRAITTLAAEELYSAAAYEHYLEFERSMSFYLTDEIIAILRDYQANRDQYPTFDDFVPVLLAKIGELKPASWLSTNYWLVLAILGPTLVATIRILALRRVRRINA